MPYVNGRIAFSSFLKKPAPVKRVGFFFYTLCSGKRYPLLEGLFCAEAFIDV
jgi:hypothetical protein